MGWEVGDGGRAGGLFCSRSWDAVELARQSLTPPQPRLPTHPPHTCSKSIFSEESKQRGVPIVAPRLPTAQDPFHLVTDRRAAAHARAPGIR